MKLQRKKLRADGSIVLGSSHDRADAFLLALALSAGVQLFMQAVRDDVHGPALVSCVLLGIGLVGLVSRTRTVLFDASRQEVRVFQGYFSGFRKPRWTLPFQDVTQVRLVETSPGPGVSSKVLILCRKGAELALGELTDEHTSAQVAEDVASLLRKGAGLHASPAHAV